jgi:hypothetical protein
VPQQISFLPEKAKKEQKNKNMSTRDAAPSDLKDPEVTQQNLPKGETWDENE